MYYFNSYNIQVINYQVIIKKIQSIYKTKTDKMTKQ